MRITVSACILCRKGIACLQDADVVSVGWSNEEPAHKDCKRVYEEATIFMYGYHNLVGGKYYWPGW